jgi:hypothetical protein
MSQWLPVIEFPEYAVSSDGIIRRVIPDKKNHSCKILRPWVNNKGYQLIHLSGANGSIKKLVSRIVCEAFNGKQPSKKHEVAHNDGNPLNNKASNLRWATRSENMEDSRRHGTMAIGRRHGRTTKPEKTPRGESHGHSILTARKVLAIRLAIKSKGVDLARKYNVSPATISVIRNRKTWSHI